MFLPLYNSIGNELRSVTHPHLVEVHAHLNSDIVCDCYITKRFTFSIQYLSATDYMAIL